jgi:hypothetical protein
VADLYEVLLVDGGERWHAGFVVDDETETDVLLRRGDGCRCSAAAPRSSTTRSSAAGCCRTTCPTRSTSTSGGLAARGLPAACAGRRARSSWHLLIDDPDAAPALSGELLDEAYDDLVTDVPGWFDATDRPPASAGRGRPAAAVGPATGLTGP